MLYYKYLFHNMPELSASEGILYSELVYRSLIVPEYFSDRGVLDVERTAAFLNEEGEVIDCCKINITKLAEALETARPAVRRGIAALRRKEFLIGSFIKCPVELVRQRYLSLPSGTRLKGRQLVFLAYLINRGRLYDGTVDTWEYRMAEDCGTTYSNVSSIIHILYKHGFIKRTADGKIKIREDLTTSSD